MSDTVKPLSASVRTPGLFAAPAREPQVVAPPAPAADILTAAPTQLSQGPTPRALALEPPATQRPIVPAQVALEPLPVFDWSLAMTPPPVPVGQLVSMPARSSDPVVNEQRLAEWRVAEEAAQSRPASGTPYHRRAAVQTFFRGLANGDEAEYQRLMALVERVALPRVSLSIAPPGARPADTRTTFERSVRSYLESGIQRGTAYALEFGPQAEEAARRYGVDVAAIYGTLRGETNMGGFTGGHNAFQQIVRSSFEGDRQEFFRGELRALVRVARERNWDLATLGGSSAGALGWCQFMPSNLVLLGDGLDPFHPVQAAELAARFYQNVGRDRPAERYTPGQPIGVELQGTPAAIRALRNDTEMTVAQLRSAGFTIPASFPATTRGRVFRFGTADRPEAFFSGPNAITIRRYNWGERHYGDRAGLLASRIVANAERYRAQQP